MCHQPTIDPSTERHMIAVLMDYWQMKTDAQKPYGNSYFKLCIDDISSCPTGLTTPRKIIRHLSNGAEPPHFKTCDACMTTRICLSFVVV